MYRKLCSRSLKNIRSAGFSLLEMAIVITIFSILISMSAGALVKIKDQQNQELTEAKLEKARMMLAAYYRANTELPCPAGLLRSYNHANFGTTLATCAPNATEGIYAISGSGSTQILKGMLPTEQLGMPKSAALDAWGNKIMYVVSTVDTSGVVGPGNIIMKDGRNPSVTISANNAVYAVISTGREGNGAWPKLSTSTPACSATRDDGQNCSISSSAGADILASDEYRPENFDNFTMWRTANGLLAEANY